MIVHIVGGVVKLFLYLWVTERSIQRLNNKVLWSFVGEAEQELDNVVSWEV